MASVHIADSNGEAICGLKPRSGETRSDKYNRDVNYVETVSIDPNFPAALGMYSNLCLRCMRKFKKENGSA